MEHLDNDMDDLFQKAGELYPLRTTEPDWDAVAGKLRNENIGDLNSVTGFTGAKVGKRKWLLLLLLIPLGLAGVIYISVLKNQEHGSAISNPATTTPAGKPDNKELTKIGLKLSPENKSRESELKESATANKSSSRDGLEARNAHNEAGDHPDKLSSINNALNSTTGTDQFRSSRKNLPAKNDIAAFQSTVTKKVESNLNSETNDLNSEAENATSSNNKSVENSPPLIQSQSGAEKKEITATESDSSQIENPKITTSDSSLIKKKSVVNSKSPKGLYIGFLAGPDLSTVAFQSVKNLGFSLGLTVGFRFNNRLSVETGFIWDKKYYYSDGAHYKNQSTAYDIVDVNGNCYMFEIPVTLRYDFSLSKNNRFFAKAGLSSYMMRKQNYSYTGESNGMQYTWTAQPNYTAMNYLFSTVHLSAGYEFSLSRKTKIQIEPYMKIPLEGIGVGKMLISSAGIYFGITHSFR
jgi:hypothetical protein